MILILSKYRFRVWNGEQDRKLYVEFLEKKTRRLLFQSMMKAVSPIEKKRNFREAMRMMKISWKYCRWCKSLIRAKTKGPLKGKAAASDTQFSLFQLYGIGRDRTLVGVKKTLSS